jgi:hypothetical protein
MEIQAGRTIVSDLVIFLDIDGVLNDHTQHENKYCGTSRYCVSAFNRLLKAFPTAKIVISSAWRYMILRGEMTIKGFEMLLLTHGVNCYERVIGHTAADPQVEPHHHNLDEWEKAGLRWRADQIRNYAAEHGIERFIVIDDLGLVIDNFYRTDGQQGLTNYDVKMIIEMWGEQS